MKLFKFVILTSLFILLSNVGFTQTLADIEIDSKIDFESNYLELLDLPECSELKLIDHIRID